MAINDEKKMKTSLPSQAERSSIDASRPYEGDPAIPEPYLRGSVSIARIDKAIRKVAEKDKPDGRKRRPSD